MQSLETASDISMKADGRGKFDQYMKMLSRQICEAIL